MVALETFSLQAIASSSSLRGRIVLLPEGDPLAIPTRWRARRAVSPSPFMPPARSRFSRRTAIPTISSAHAASDSAPSSSELPAAQIGREDAQSIREELAHGRVRMSLELINRVTPGAATVNNVIADILGRDRPDEWVIVGAHLDSWDFGAGAQDNATGVAMVLEAARAIAALKQPPRRSIRFALWGGEEQGQLGSAAYALAHASDLVRVVAVLNTDAGTGRVIGWTAPGRPDLVRAVRPLTQDFLNELGAADIRRKPALRLPVRRRAVHPGGHSDARSERGRYRLRRDSPQGGRHDRAGRRRTISRPAQPWSPRRPTRSRTRPGRSRRGSIVGRSSACGKRGTDTREPIACVVVSSGGTPEEEWESSASTAQTIRASPAIAACATASCCDRGIVCRRRTTDGAAGGRRRPVPGAVRPAQSGGVARSRTGDRGVRRRGADPSSATRRCWLKSPATTCTVDVWRWCTGRRTGRWTSCWRRCGRWWSSKRLRTRTTSAASSAMPRHLAPACC